MFEALGNRLRGLYEKSKRLTPVDWLVLTLSVAALAVAVYAGAVQLRRQGRSREMLAQVKAARLAASVVSSECYGMGKPFADFTTDDGLSAGLQQEICDVGSLPGSVQLLQTDETGYVVQSLAYTEDGYLAVYDADGSWQIYRTEHRITTVFAASSTAEAGK